MLITIVAGARPNFMKIAPIIKAITRCKAQGKDISFRIVHTGQHFDAKMSGEIFKQLEIPEPDINLGVGGGSQAQQTASIMIGFEAEFINHRSNNTLYRGILMPFSSDDDTIDFIYGVINWKEIADEALTHELNDAVEQALAQQPVRHAPTAPVWADGPSAAIVEGSVPPSSNLAQSTGEDFGDDEDFAEDPVILDGSEGLGDLLHAARTGADIAKHAEGRSRAKLYRALGLAYDFALVADARPDEYAELLADSGLKAQDRAPMTPIVKLVFGIDYDKTRLAEFGAALSYARKQGLGVGAFTGWLESFPGALKGIVSAERAERRPDRKVRVAEPVNVNKARTMPALGVIQLEADSEFIILVARKIDDDHVAVIGRAGDDALVDRALRSL